MNPITQEINQWELFVDVAGSVLGAIGDLPARIASVLANAIASEQSEKKTMMEVNPSRVPSKPIPACNKSILFQLIKNFGSNSVLIQLGPHIGKEDLLYMLEIKFNHNYSKHLEEVIRENRDKVNLSDFKISETNEIGLGDLYPAIQSILELSESAEEALELLNKIKSELKKY